MPQRKAAKTSLAEVLDAIPAAPVKITTNKQERDPLDPDNIALQAALITTQKRKDDPDFELREWSLSVLKKSGRVCNDWAVDKLVEYARRFGPGVQFCGSCGARGSEGCWAVCFEA